MPNLAVPCMPWRALAQLPGQGEMRAPTVRVVHGDSEESMRPKEAVIDVRKSAMAYAQSRQLNPRLPLAHTSVVLRDDAQGGDDSDDDLGRSRALY